MDPRQENSMSKGMEAVRPSVLRKGQSMRLDGAIFPGEDGMASS